MILGHSAFALILTVLLGSLIGEQNDKIIYTAIAVAILAALPDIDILFAIIGFIEVVLTTGLREPVPTVFWEQSILHRTVTHSIIFTSLASVFFATYAAKLSHGVQHIILTLVFTCIVIVGLLISGVSGILLSVLFIGCGLFIINKLKGRTFSYNLFVASMFLSLFLHPFQDFFTGHPPQVLAPVMRTTFETIIIHQNDVINTVILFLIESTVVLTSITLCIRYLDIDISLQDIGKSVSVSLLLTTSFLILANLLTTYDTAIFFFATTGITITYTSSSLGFVSLKKYTQNQLSNTICILIGAAFTSLLSYSVYYYLV